jgi:hypothetical protein
MGTNIDSQINFKLFAKPHEILNSKYSRLLLVEICEAHRIDNRKLLLYDYTE